MDSKGDIVSLDDSIETYFDLNIKLLSCMGIRVNLSDNSKIETRKLLYQAPALLVLSLQTYCLCCQFIMIADGMKNHQYLAVTKVCCDLCSNVLIAVRGAQLILNTTKVNALLQELASIWRQHVPGHKIRHKILRKANNALIVCNILVAMTIGGSPIYGLPSLFKLTKNYVHRNEANYTFDYSKRVFFMLYPFEVNSNLSYFLIILEEEYILAGIVIFYMCADSLFAQLTTHTSLQFEILCADIKSLMDGKISDSIFKKDFAILVERHKHLLSICKRIEEIFSLVILITMIVAGLHICFNIFDILEYIDSGEPKEALSHAYLLATTMFEIAFYCIFAEALTQRTTAIGDAIYNSNWNMNIDNKSRIYVQMMIVKSQNPFYCTAYGFFPIGHIQLTKIVNAALSYLMMLRATT